MDFQITPLSAQDFAPLFSLSDAELLKRNARRKTVSENPGVPCRVSLEEAELGETVLLLNHVHQDAQSPYRASHAVYVRETAEDAAPRVNEVPEVIRSRLISIRLFGSDDLMIDGDVLQGDQVANAISTAFDDPLVAYIHVHFAKRGCFAASAHRVL